MLVNSETLPRPRPLRCLPALLISLTLLASCGPSYEVLDESRQATGVKVGEVTASSAIVAMRLTEKAERRSDGILRRKRSVKKVPPVIPNVPDLEGSAPGAPGRVRVCYSTQAGAFDNFPQGPADAQETPWQEVRPEDDFTHQFAITGLQPSTVYYYSAETSNLDGSVLHQPLLGQFETAPPADEYADVTFTVITGQMYMHSDHKDGFMAYDSMAALSPKFIVPTGDTVYYDSDDPPAATIDIARYHWHRMYSFPKLIDFHLKVPTYFEKDDHDSHLNDGWPGLMRPFMSPFTFEEGLKVYNEQVPMSEKPYRTFRWGKGLQVWVLEGRDFRSPNTMEDGPDKTIWGAEQKKWLKETLLASDADWKVLISPTPIVGPDRSNKHDNHSNVDFTHEGDEFRNFVKENLADNYFGACGDRHWQYHSVHPKSGMHEFSSGPISDIHAGGSPGHDPVYHQFHREMGGFLSVQAKKVGDESTIAFRLHAVDGNVEYEYTRAVAVE